MFSLATKLVEAVTRWFKGKTPPAASEKRKARQPLGRADVEENGQWYFRRDILEKLPDYMRHIKRMKKTDRSGYRFYKKIGAVILPAKQLFDVGDLEIPVENIPAFGAIALMRYTDEADNDTIPMKFMYFHKLEKTPFVIQPTNGTVFQVTGYWDESVKLPGLNYGAAVSFYLSVDKNGKITALKERGYIPQTLKHKCKGKDTGEKRSVVWHKKSFYPDVLTIKKDAGDGRLWDESVDERAQFLFCLAVNSYVNAGTGVRVAATKNNTSAVFTVDMLRTPYFFADRETTFTTTGRKQRIFHIVRTHPRQVNGRTTYVKTHFRGLRRFNWNGYHVNITVPGWHHGDVVDFKAPSTEVTEFDQIPDGYRDMKNLGKLVSKHMDV